MFKSKKFLFALALIASIIAVPLSKVNAAATITVNSTSDDAANDGVCTLREAIASANSDTVSGAAGGECVAGSGVDTIEFDISGGGVKTFQPATPYDNITEAVTIDGYSQAGAAENTADMESAFNGAILIEIDGSLQGDDTTILSEPMIRLILLQLQISRVLLAA
jgi:CSLREA domain-containing protein